MFDQKVVYYLLFSLCHYCLGGFCDCAYNRGYILKQKKQVLTSITLNTVIQVLQLQFFFITLKLKSVKFLTDQTVHIFIYIKFLILRCK